MPNGREGKVAVKFGGLCTAFARRFASAHTFVQVADEFSAAQMPCRPPPTRLTTTEGKLSLSFSALFAMMPPLEVTHVDEKRHPSIVRKNS